MTTAFENVSVVPMDSERVLADQTVVADGDRISWIGPTAEAEVPADAERIDGRGKYLIPGLADMHSHPADEDDLLLLVTHGVTTIRNLFGMPRHVRWRERVAAGRLLGPRIVTSGPVVDGRPPRSNGNFSVVTREEAIAAVEQTKRGGYDCVKVYDQLTPEAYRWVVEAAHERDLPVDGHIPFQVGLDTILDAGQRSIEHLYGYPQALQPGRSSSVPHDLGQLRKWLFSMAQNAEFERMEDLAGRTIEAGTWNCATLIVRTRWAQDPADLAARHEMKYLSPRHRVEARYFFDHYPKQEPERFLMRDFNAAVLRGLNEAGAGIMIGTDALVPGIVYGASVHQELEAFVDAGLSPFEALRAATTGPAEFLGESGQWGQVTSGAYADLVLLEANPLTDIANTTRRAGVMARGRWLPSTEVDTLLENLAARRQNPTLPRLEGADPTPASDAEPLKFRMTWAGHRLGEDTVASVEQPAGGRRVHATLSVDGFEYESGVYQASVEIDAFGVDQSGSFEFHSNDGVDRVEMTRIGGAVHVKQNEPSGGEIELTVSDPDGSALFGRPHAALYVRVAERLAGLAVGAETDVRIVAAGLPADMVPGEAAMHAVRLPDSDDNADEGPRYLVEFRRPNWRTSALLACDRENRPIAIELGSDMAYWHNNTGTDQPDEESVIRVARVTAG